MREWQIALVTQGLLETLAVEEVPAKEVESDSSF